MSWKLRKMDGGREMDDNEFRYADVVHIVKEGGANEQGITDPFQHRDGAGCSGRPEDGDKEDMQGWEPLYCAGYGVL